VDEHLPPSLGRAQRPRPAVAGPGGL